MPQARPAKRDLTQAQQDQIIRYLGEIHRSSGRRPWMVVIRQIDGVIQLYEAQAPVRVDSDVTGRL